MNPRAPEAARQFAVGLLHAIGETGTVESSAEGDGVYLDLRGSFRTIPAGDGAFRAALARLARQHLKSHHGLDVPVVVDINGEVLAHREELAARVREVARQVAADGRRVELAPMPADDRRVVHVAMAGIPGVRTVSIGRDQNRRVVIEPVAGP